MKFTTSYTAQDIHTESTQHSKGWERCDRLNAKEYLNQIRDLDTLIDVKCKTRAQLEIKAQQVSSPELKERVLSSGTSGFAQTVDKIVDLDNEISQQIDDLLKLQSDAINKINQLSDKKHIAILTEYYLNQETWERVADIMKLSVRHIHRLHGKALQEFRKKFNMF